MKTIIKRYKKKFGYIPTIYELYNLYSQGILKLNDKEENDLIKQITIKNYKK
tara:strand:- start:677 stop:832 length:156 start_codon:yes stop_codon:yes gene_type:complete